MLIAYGLTKYTKDGEEKTKWTAIGSAWKNKDGSLSVELEAMPVSGRLQIREPKPKDGGPSR
ncbi:MAG: hypothetical protein A2V88_08305 [Elusimicrobia bacterium RBG_16_66_12]|nr:MAG: hypothetical protein A2V88_08305 [Elusimicrobia bacterium RBG_16_66_12]